LFRHAYTVVHPSRGRPRRRSSLALRRHSTPVVETVSCRSPVTFLCRAISVMVFCRSPDPTHLPCYFDNGLLPLLRPTYIPLHVSDYYCMSRAATPSASKSSSASQQLTPDTTKFSKNASSTCNSHLLVPSSILAQNHSMPLLTSVSSSSSPYLCIETQRRLPLLFAYFHGNIVDSLRLRAFLIPLPFQATKFRETLQIDDQIKYAFPNSLRHHKSMSHLLLSPR